MLYNTTGNSNSAYGNSALSLNTTGYENTTSGKEAMSSNTTGFLNTSIGSQSLYTNSTGFYNTSVGARSDVSKSDLTNATSIGAFAIVDASNKVRIGNTSVTSIGGQVGWTTFSDGRYKKDIKENVPGLAFINSLRPITYTVNVKGLNDYYNRGRKQVRGNRVSDSEEEAVITEMKKEEDFASRIVYDGFIAQEVEEVAKKLNFEFSGVDKPKEKDGIYGLRYDNFVIPLVKAVQELSQQSNEKDKKIAELEYRLAKVEKLISQQPQQSQDEELRATARLEQNIPNPFNNATSIGYYLSVNKGNAYINFYLSNGALLKSVKLQNTGKGTITVKSSELPSGVYQYALFIDGKVVDSKQMIEGK